jgi:hypothetical protein
MVGQTIESRNGFPVGAFLGALAGLGLCVVAAATANLHWLMASLLPWLYAVLLLAGRERPFRASFTDTAVEVDEPPLSVPYAEMQGLLAGRRSPNPYRVGPRSYPIQVIYPGGVLRIPPRLDVLSDKVYSFLLSHFGSRGARDVHPKLAEYRLSQEKRYGSGRVWSYVAREYQGRPAEYRGLRAFFLAVLLSATCWLVFGLATSQPEWAVGGGFGMLFGGLFGFLIWIQIRLQKVPKKLRKASLVISPDGLALIQGDLEGRLRWGEVRNVQFKRRVAHSFQFAGSVIAAGIVLKVEGASVPILDLYDRPLALIHQLIDYYWCGQGADEPAASSWHFDPAQLEVFGGEERPGRREGEGITRGE